MFDLNSSLAHSVATDLRPIVTPGDAAPPPGVEPPTPSSHRSRPKLLWSMAVVALVLLAAWALTSVRAGARSPSADTIRTATAERREFIRSLRVTGTVEATQSYIVTAPTLTGASGAGGGFSTLIITHMAAAGSKVKKGDLLVEFDRQNQIKNALDREAEYRDLLEQIKKKQAEQAVARTHDETELHQAEDAAKTAELETRRNEVVSRIDAEKNLANLEEARARFKQLKETFELKRQAARAELRILEIQRDRAAAAMRHAQVNADKMEVRAPLEGTVVLNAIWKGGQSAEVQEGDEIRSGQPFMQIMNPQSMLVRSRVNQADVPLIHVSQAVAVRLDAYPGLVLPGRVERVSSIGLTSGMSPKVRTFTVLFSILGADAKLMPDLTASVDVELLKIPNSILIPRDALLTDAGGSYVWVKRGSTFEREPVKVAAIGETDAAIESGLDAGAVVLRTPNPRARVQ